MSTLTPSLVERALGGDDAACRTLVDALTPVVQARVNAALDRRAALGRGRRVRQEMLDLTQEVFVALFARDGRVLRRWDPERGATLQTFVGLVAEREVRAVLRSKRRSPWTEDPTRPDDFTTSTAAPPADGRMASKETLRAVLDRLRTRLSDRGLELFEALVVEGRPVEEVAAAHGMSREAIYTWRSRLRRTVAEIAAELGEAG
ncbi:MAG: sigma-70 family RNA polymerase sigma factor [bacterium]|nr:sigma-70 family RNA polymerase sigma factor [Myxococcales bacterium]MCB9551479.1 sigma-70 family RNA polymerase sigma factor [Myxococcales bacterium]